MDTRIATTCLLLFGLSVLTSRAEDALPADEAPPDSTLHAPVGLSTAWAHAMAAAKRTLSSSAKPLVDFLREKKTHESLDPDMIVEPPSNAEAHIQVLKPDPELDLKMPVLGTKPSLPMLYIPKRRNR